MSDNEANAYVVVHHEWDNYEGVWVKQLVRVFLVEAQAMKLAKKLNDNASPNDFYQVECTSIEF